MIIKSLLILMFLEAKKWHKKENIMSISTVSDLIEFGLWPRQKKVIGELDLLKIGYQMFYEGKNADMYFLPGSSSVLMVRTDRTSVNDILLSDTIEGKGEIQNKISNFGYDFAEQMGIKTARLEMPVNIPSDIAVRSQHIQLAKALSINVPGIGETGLELIFRNYLTGSLYKLYKEGKDPYGLNLPEGLEEWHKFDVPIFTPTTKGTSDEPLDYNFVLEAYPEEVNQLMNLFISFTDYADQKGIVLVDTKFEMFGDFLGDEILTPESSRFIKKSNFEDGFNISMDKQILRDCAKEEGWIEKGTKGQLLYVNIPENVKNTVISGYYKIYNMLLE